MISYEFIDVIQLVLAGGLVGFVIGLTGVGGGSLMTPYLLWYGIPPSIAVGTDLLYAAITKSNGIRTHHQLKQIHWPSVVCLAMTSIPCAILTAWLLSLWFEQGFDANGVIHLALGFMLLATGAGLLFSPLLSRKKFKHKVQIEDLSQVQLTRKNRLLLIGIGAPLGSLVALSSIGAGVIGTMVLMIVLPQLQARFIVGTDLAHAVPLTFAAGLSHLILLNSVDWWLLFSLLIGALPCVSHRIKNEPTGSRSLFKKCPGYYFV